MKYRVQNESLCAKYKRLYIEKGLEGLHIKHLRHTLRTYSATRKHRHLTYSVEKREKQEFSLNWSSRL
jgi:hypothetical protein